MKRIAWVVAAALLAACTANSPEIPEKGLSKTLANERAATLDSITYKLHFTIPNSLTDLVKGEAEITFLLKKRPQSLVLDFTNPDSSSLKVVSVGEEINPEVLICNGHVVIPKRYLSKGENRVRLSFASDSRTLNRNQDYLYTLNVPNKASRVFPCFDQPNLKAYFALDLTLPACWNAVSNGSVVADSIINGRRCLTFSPSQKISTYLFAFAAGIFNKVERTTNGMPIAIYYAQTDSSRLKENVDEIYNQVEQSLRFMEDYTGIKYPFEKYDLVLIPSFQFGGMEHPGATYYKSSKLLLDENASLFDNMSRTSLIAHETAHMWFGDLVTMSWFNDVWLKEVFAGLFSEKITNPQYPTIDHNLLFMLSNYPKALSVDRTAGTHPIAQELENQDNAASLYGAIIYNKAPIAMRMLEEKMGEEPFWQALREYLSHYSYGNAIWDDLLATFQRQTKEDLSAWNKAWIAGKGVPEVEVSMKREGDKEAIAATNTRIANPQAVALNVVDGKISTKVSFKALPGNASVMVSANQSVVLPNSDGKAYAIFTGDVARQFYSTSNLMQMTSLERASLLINQKELAIAGKISRKSYCDFIQTFTQAETVDALLQQSVKDIEFCFLQLLTATERKEVSLPIEQLLWNKMMAQGKPSEQFTMLKSLMRIATSGNMLDKLQAILAKNEITSKAKLSERDGMLLALELAFKVPEKANTIISMQRERIKSEELKAQLDFERTAISWNSDTLNALFQKLRIKENRMKEPWVSEALSYIHHPLRNEACVAMLIPALKMLPEVKQTGDIFFPKSWAEAVLWGYRSPKAKQQVEQLMQGNLLSPDLKLKVLQSGDLLMRQ